MSEKIIKGKKGLLFFYEFGKENSIRCEIIDYDENFLLVKTKDNYIAFPRNTTIIQKFKWSVILDDI